MIRPFKRPILILILLLAAGRGSKRFRGGSQKKRDCWFGLENKPDFDDFRPWWHREGKESWGGADIASKEEAEAAYNEWVQLERPKVERKVKRKPWSTGQIR
jgi:hypothetical protein